MLDLGQRWPDVPDWTAARMEGPDFTVEPVNGLTSWLVSGNLDAFAARSGLSAQGAGALGLATGKRYSVRLARSRLFVVGLGETELAHGWNEPGFAASPVSAAWQAFDLTGPGMARILSEATAINPADPGPSASIVFAGLGAIVYRHGEEGRIRLHVERGHAAALWHWFGLAARAGR